VHAVARAAGRLRHHGHEITQGLGEPRQRKSRANNKMMMKRE
jgi:hypothetical protein